jgi:hypothetical protein
MGLLIYSFASSGLIGSGRVLILLYNNNNVPAASHYCVVSRELTKIRFQREIEQLARFNSCRRVHV